MTNATNPLTIGRTAFAALALVTVLSGCNLYEAIPEELRAGYEPATAIDYGGGYISVVRSTQTGQLVAVLTDGTTIPCNSEQEEDCREAVRRARERPPQESIQDL